MYTIDSMRGRPRIRNRFRLNSLVSPFCSHRHLIPILLMCASVGCGVHIGDIEFPDEFRTIDGSENNLDHTDWGQAGTPLLRLTTVGYGDGAGTPAGASRPSARAISNLCAASPGPVFSSHGLSDMFWQWGQFLDHDIDLTPIIVPLEPFDIPVPEDDPFFTGIPIIPLDRSFYLIVFGVRQQTNDITSYIDASNVYGSDYMRANALRALDGSGKMKTSEGNLLPFNEDGLPNAPNSSAGFFLAGDFRANEQVGLTAMHTLFVREHNHWARIIGLFFPELDGDAIYQRARAIVAAEMQWITYNEFLPRLLGPDAFPPYGGYDDQINAGIANVFSTAAYRFGHTMLSSELLRLNRKRKTIKAGNIALLDAFFNPEEITSVGIAPYLRGLTHQLAREVDMFVVDDVRNFLFGPPGAGGSDLASLNIQRGRDHGLSSYNQTRTDLGLAPAASFADVSSDAVVQAKLQSAYGTVDDMDLWIAGLAEDHVPGATVGETFWTIIQEQFLALRDGDRFWFENYLSEEFQRFIKTQTLSRIIKRNTPIRKEIGRDAFTASGV